EREARKIASWGGTTYIKVPITNTRGQSSIPLIRHLSGDGLALNVTAILTLRQIEAATEALDGNSAPIVSVFGGRIADTGVDPVPIVRCAVKIAASGTRTEILWASPRELLNLWQAEQCGCHIITATPELLQKLNLIGKDLEEYSLETVRMFYRDAAAAGYSIV